MKDTIFFDTVLAIALLCHFGNVEMPLGPWASEDHSFLVLYDYCFFFPLSDSHTRGFSWIIKKMSGFYCYQTCKLFDSQSVVMAMKILTERGRVERLSLSWSVGLTKATARMACSWSFPYISSWPNVIKSAFKYADPSSVQLVLDIVTTTMWCYFDNLK